MIQKSIPIHPPFSPNSLKLLQDLSTYEHNNNEGKDMIIESTCEPFWGPEKPYRYILFLFCMAVYLFILLSIPLSIILWLLGSSIFYIFFEREYKRRELIENRYQQEKLKMKSNKVE